MCRTPAGRAPGRLVDVGPLGEIFNPGMRHEIEERRSKALRREEDGNARDTDLRIDLESGFVNITAPPAPPAPEATTEKDDDSDDDASTSRGVHRS